MDTIQEKQIRKLSVQQLLANVQEQVETLFSYDAKVPKIEIDIVKENLRKLYELIDSLDKPAIAKPIVNQSTVEDIDKEITDLLDNAKVQFEEEEKEIDSQIDEQEIVLEEQSEEEVIKPEIPNEEEIAAVHLDIEKDSDTNREEGNRKEERGEGNRKEERGEGNRKEEKEIKVKKTIHVLDVMPEEEEMEEEVEKESLIINKLKRKPIKSLKSGIGINDKFMIINDLFEGNNKAFNKALNKLDSQEDGQKAIFLLEDMRDENLWQLTDSIYQSFKTYVERRYL